MISWPLLFKLKIGPWGPELIWQLATEYKMNSHQRHLQYVIMYIITNEGGVAELTWQGYISFSFMLKVTILANLGLKVELK